MTSLFWSDGGLCLGTFQICIPTKQQAIDCEFSPDARLSGFWSLGLLSLSFSAFDADVKSLGLTDSQSGWRECEDEGN